MRYNYTNRNTYAFTLFFNHFYTREGIFMIKFKEMSYKNFGRCILMSNGLVELAATLDVGPRIIRFSKVGGENILLEDIDRKVNQDDNRVLFAKNFGSDMGTWQMYGGHRLWASPEAMPRTYYPDNQPIDFKTEGNRLILMPKPQVVTRQQLRIEIVMSEDSPKADIYHYITNLSLWSQEFAPWALTVLSVGGVEVVPMPNRPTGLLHNRKLTLWDYARMNDTRVTWGDKYIILRQNPDAEGPFKFGIDSQHGWAAYFNHGDVFLKKFDIIEGADYPDEGMCFETYTNPIFLEMESLGALKRVKPGETSSHHESWELIPDLSLPSENEDDIERTLSPYIN